MDLLDWKIFSGYIFDAAWFPLKTEKRTKCCRFKNNVTNQMNGMVKFLWLALYNKK